MENMNARVVYSVLLCLNVTIQKKKKLLNSTFLLLLVTLYKVVGHTSAVSLAANFVDSLDEILKCDHS